jgi:hypothetical protein
LSSSSCTVNAREALAQAAADTSECDDWTDLPVDAYEHAQAHNPAWALADIAAKLAAHRIQHCCISATVEGGYELADDEPCLVLRQLAAVESAPPAHGAWE